MATGFLRKVVEVRGYNGCMSMLHMHEGMQRDEERCSYGPRCLRMGYAVSYSRSFLALFLITSIISNFSFKFRPRLRFVMP